MIVITRKGYEKTTFKIKKSVDKDAKNSHGKAIRDYFFDVRAEGEKG